MEDHTTKLNNVHTQLLLQMQIDSNIQEMKERLHSTQKELHATQNDLKTKENTLLTTQSEFKATQNELKATQNELKATQNELKTTQNELKTAQSELKTTQSELKETQSELKATKVKLEQTMEELTHSKENSTKRENEMKFLQENIQKGIENIQKQNDNGLKMNHQITESFATYCSTSEQKQEFTKDETLDTFFVYFQIKKPATKIIETIEINGMKLEFSKINELVQNLNKSYNISYEEKHKTLLKKMKIGEVHHINNKQLIFKLNLPKNHRRLYIKHYNDIASIATNHAKYVVVKNDQLVVLDSPFNNNDYQICLQIPNYNGNSHCYLYPKNEHGDKLLLKTGAWNNDVNMDDYKTASNEILFHVIKK